MGMDPADDTEDVNPRGQCVENRQETIEEEIEIDESDDVELLQPGTPATAKETRPWTRPERPERS